MDTNAIYVDQERYNEYLQSIKKAEENLREIQQRKNDFIAEYDSDSYSTPEFHQLNISEQIAQKALMDLREILSKLKVVDSTDISEIITIGSTVTLCIDMGDMHNTITFTLVAHSSKNMDEVSIESPIGMAVINKHINEIVTYYVGEKAIQATILDIK